MDKASVLWVKDTDTAYEHDSVVAVQYDTGRWELDMDPIHNIPILGNGHVQLMDKMPRLYPMDWAVITAARHSVRGALKTPKADARLIQLMYNQDHSSPFEQAVFQFEVDVPVIVWWHIVRHRTARLNLESGRFRELRNKFYIPEVWYTQGTGKGKQQAGTQLNDIDSKELSRKLKARVEQGWEDYQHALRLGVVRDQARYFLNFGNIYYQGVWQMDANNLMKFLSKRTASDAQTETQEFGRALETIFAAEMPLTYRFFKRKRRAMQKMTADLESMKIVEEEDGIEV